MEQTKKIKFAVGSHHEKLNVLPYSYQFPTVTCSQLIVNLLLGSVSENVPPLWTLSSNEANHVNNDMIMWNTMKCFMSEVKRAAILLLIILCLDQSQCPKGMRITGRWCSMPWTDSKETIDSVPIWLSLLLCIRFYCSISGGITY